MIFSIILLFCAPIFWYGLAVWLVRLYKRTPDANPALLWPVHFSILAVVGIVLVSLLATDEYMWLAFIATALFPPFVLAFLFLTPFLLTTMVPVGLVVLLLTAVPRKTRASALLLATLAMGLSIPITADLYWDRKLCAAAAGQGLGDVQRAPFLYNLRRAGDKSGREPYAIADKDGQVWDWSYYREAFVPYGGTIPPWADLSGFAPLDCANPPV